MNVHSSNPSEFRAAARVARIGVSEILKITATANAARAQGRDVIVLGAGEPDFDTPDYIKQAAMEAIRRGETKYTVLDGSNEMKLAIQAKFQRENGLRFELNEISVSAGAKQVLFNALMASLDPGDEVIVAAPYWTTYVDMVSICGGKAVVVETSEQNGFRLTPESLERAITPKTRWLLLNSPSNPSGSAYSAKELRDLTDVIARHRHVWIMADDIYEHIIYDRLEFATPRKVAPDLADRILTINGVSKAYAMTGWRLGYGAGPKLLIEAMAVVQSQSTSCPSSVSQAAAIAALMHPHAVVGDRCLEFQARRDRLVSALNGIDGLSFRRPEGAFYAFVNCAGLIGRRTAKGDIIKSDVDYCRFLIESVGVAVVPGSCFGLAPYIRLSYATSNAVLEDACNRLAHASTLLLQ